MATRTVVKGSAESGGDEPHGDPPGGDASNGAEAERAASIVASLGKGQASAEEVFEAFDELDRLPPEVVRAALGAWTGPAPDPERLDDALRSAHGFPPRALHLGTVAVVKDADVLDLGPVAEDQIRVAGKTWDGVDLAPEDRLDGENEGSFAGTLQHRVLAEAGPTAKASKTPLFDVLLFAEDSGVIFRAGTTDLVGSIAYGTVEMRDRRLRTAIQNALASAVETDDAIEAAPSTRARAVETAIEEEVEAAPPAIAENDHVEAEVEEIDEPVTRRLPKKKTAAAASTKTKKKSAAAPKKKVATAPKKKVATPKKKSAAAPAKKAAAKKKSAAAPKKAAPKKAAPKKKASKRTAASGDT